MAYKESFRNSYDKYRHKTSTNTTLLQKVGIIAVIVALVTAGILGVIGGRDSFFKGKAGTGESVKVLDPNNPNGRVVRNEITTGSAVSTDDNSEVRIKLYVDSSHDFKEIWANYSDDIGTLDNSPGTVNSPPNETPAGDDLHEVLVDVSTLEEGTTYYYQAVGKTQDDSLVYGQIASFSLGSL